MYAAEAYCGGFFAELGDGGGEAFDVQTGGVGVPVRMLSPILLAYSVLSGAHRPDRICRSQLAFLSVSLTA